MKKSFFKNHGIGGVAIFFAMISLVSTSSDAGNWETDIHCLTLIQVSRGLTYDSSQEHSENTKIWFKQFVIHFSNDEHINGIAKSHILKPEEIDLPFIDGQGNEVTDEKLMPFKENRLSQLTSLDEIEVSVSPRGDNTDLGLHAKEKEEVIYVSGDIDIGANAFVGFKSAKMAGGKPIYIFLMASCHQVKKEEDKKKD